MVSSFVVHIPLSFHCHLFQRDASTMPLSTTLLFEPIFPQGMLTTFTQFSFDRNFRKKKRSQYQYAVLNDTSQETLQPALFFYH